ncbi:hypothetical protein H9Q70_006278 [Fusarium xylarioides]|nr:hypothetical protein H9Q70_006278 [Fusarium xylarioides]KAG5780002.1 hypothetical protein H9Q73_006312 [Fusarium xylarioides]KAG5811052.1 hypothetical protein H9Q71_005097 [Fusarium xylarioides]KAG5823271.1 hypothetical protein H9Q74_006653 [Fusarium xylarioides]
MGKYILDACTKLHDEVDALGDRYSDAISPIGKNNPLVSGKICPLGSVVGALSAGLLNLGHYVRELEKAMGSTGHAFYDPRPDKVSAVSLRVVRLWCTLNTKTCREEVRNLDKSGFESFFGKVEAMINIDSNSHAVLKKMRNVSGPGTIHSVNPVVFFVCLGIGFDDDGKSYAIHRDCHTGGTQERLESWPEFHSIRLNARHAHIGDGYIKACLEYYQALEKLQAQASNHGLTEEAMRQTMSRFALQGMAVPTTISALPFWDTLKEPLRSVRDHAGRAFKDNNDKWIHEGCCYGCKTSIRFDEASTDEAALAVNIDDMAHKFNIRSRLGGNVMDHAHSCAEVQASHHCAMACLN